MKFLKNEGDSVVSLRFLNLEAPSGDYEAVDAAPDRLTFDTVGEIQAGLADLFEDGEAPFNLQEQVLDLDAFRADSESDDRAMLAQLQQFQTNLYLTLDNGGNQDEVPAFMDALQEFMTGYAPDIEGFREEEAALKEEVEYTSARVEAGAETRLAMAELVGDITGEGLERDAALTESGERTPDRPLLSVSTTVEALPVTLNEAVASVEDDIATTFGASSFNGFSEDLFA